MIGNVKIAIPALFLLGVALSGCAGTGSSGAEKLVSTLHASYNDQPFKGGQPTPDHEWSWTDGSGAKGKIALLHWMPKTHDGTDTGGDAEKADHLFATGDGFKARFCGGTGGVSEDQWNAGYVHFHKETSADWNAGHGGDSKDRVGYWLRHIAAESGIEMMDGVVSKAGEVYLLMPSAPEYEDVPAC